MDPGQATGGARRRATGSLPASHRFDPTHPAEDEAQAAWRAIEAFQQESKAASPEAAAEQLTTIGHWTARYGKSKTFYAQALENAAKAYATRVPGA